MAGKGKKSRTQKRRGNRGHIPQEPQKPKEQEVKPSEEQAAGLVLTDLDAFYQKFHAIYQLSGEFKKLIEDQFLLGKPTKTSLPFVQSLEGKRNEITAAYGRVKGDFDQVKVRANTEQLGLLQHHIYKTEYTSLFARQMHAHYKVAYATDTFSIKQLSGGQLKNLQANAWGYLNDLLLMFSSGKVTRDAEEQLMLLKLKKAMASTPAYSNYLPSILTDIREFQGKGTTQSDVWDDAWAEYRQSESYHGVMCQIKKGADEKAQKVLRHLKQYRDQKGCDHASLDYANSFLYESCLRSAVCSGDVSILIGQVKEDPHVPSDRLFGIQLGVARQKFGVIFEAYEAYSQSAGKADAKKVTQHFVQSLGVLIPALKILLPLLNVATDAARLTNLERYVAFLENATALLTRLQTNDVKNMGPWSDLVWDQGRVTQGDVIEAKPIQACINEVGLALASAQADHKVLQENIAFAEAKKAADLIAQSERHEAFKVEVDAEFDARAAKHAAKIQAIMRKRVRADLEGWKKAEQKERDAEAQEAADAKANASEEEVELPLYQQHYYQGLEATQQALKALTASDKESFTLAIGEAIRLLHYADNMAYYGEAKGTRLNQVWEGFLDPSSEYTRITNETMVEGDSDPFLVAAALVGLAETEILQAIQSYKEDNLSSTIVKFRQAHKAAEEAMKEFVRAKEMTQGQECDYCDAFKEELPDAIMLVLEHAEARIHAVAAQIEHNANKHAQKRREVMASCEKHHPGFWKNNPRMESGNFEALSPEAKVHHFVRCEDALAAEVLAETQELSQVAQRLPHIDSTQMLEKELEGYRAQVRQVSSQEDSLYIAPTSVRPRSQPQMSVEPIECTHAPNLDDVSTFPVYPVLPAGSTLPVPSATPVANDQTGFAAAFWGKLSPRRDL